MSLDDPWAELDAEWSAGELFRLLSVAASASNRSASASVVDLLKPRGGGVGAASRHQVKARVLLAPLFASRLPNDIPFDVREPLARATAVLSRDEHPKAHLGAEVHFAAATMRSYYTCPGVLSVDGTTTRAAEMMHRWAVWDEQRERQQQEMHCSDSGGAADAQTVTSLRLEKLRGALRARSRAAQLRSAETAVLSGQLQSAACETLWAHELCCPRLVSFVAQPVTTSLDDVPKGRLEVDEASHQEEEEQRSHLTTKPKPQQGLLLAEALLAPPLDLPTEDEVVENMDVRLFNNHQSAEKSQHAIAEDAVWVQPNEELVFIDGRMVKREKKPKRVLAKKPIVIGVASKEDAVKAAAAGAAGASAAAAGAGRANAQPTRGAQSSLSSHPPIHHDDGGHDSGDPRGDARLPVLREGSAVDRLVVRLRTKAHVYDALVVGLEGGT